MGGGRGGFGVFGTPPRGILLGHFPIWNPQLKPSRLAPFLSKLGIRGGLLDMSKSQRNTRSGAGHGVSQADEAAIYPKLTGLYQHEIVCEFLKKWKQCGTVQASYGCLMGYVCMSVRISVFAP